MRGAQHDVFPAHVIVAPADSAIDLHDLKPLKRAVEGYKVDVARVTVANNRVLIARDDPAGPLVVFNDTLNTFEPATDRNGISFLTTRSGQKIAYVRDSSCGCGSRLRSWNPLRFFTSTEG